jgi:outer membrane receptor for ferrienterochelin and colicins
VTRFALVLIALAMVAPARADGDATPAPTPPPGVVDVDDLPPLPAAEGEPGSAAAVISAADVEEDVVVGAAKREQTLGNVASAVTVISADRLRRFGYRTLAEALRGVAGLYIDDDHITSRLGIRGLQVPGDFNTRILVLIDGATINEPWDQFVGLDWDLPVTIDDVERVEVIRGPVSSVYGTNAFFGILNIVTRGAAESPRAWGRVSTSSFSDVSEAAGFAQGDVDHQIRGTVAALYRGGESLTRTIDPALGPTALADGMVGWHAALVGTYEGAFAQVRAYRRVRELSFAPYNTRPGSHDTRNTDDQIMAEGGYAHTFGKLAMTARGYIDRYHFGDFLDNSDGTTFEDTGDSFWFGAEVRGRYAVLPDERLGVTAGAEVTHEATRSRSYYTGMQATGADVPKDFELGGVYAEVDARPRPWLSVTGGVRHDSNSALDARTSPRAALFLSRGDDYGVKLLYAQGFRNPSAYEGFFHDDVSFVANPDIHSETITSYEAVVWGRPVPGLSARLSGFRWQARDLIVQGDAPGGAGLIQFQNQGGLDSTGLELEGTYRTASGWYGYGGGAFASVSVPGSSAAVASAPRWTGAGGVSTPRLGGVAHLSTELVYVGAAPTRAAAIEAAAWLGVNLIAYVPDFHHVDVTIGVRNLIGRRQQIVASDDFDRTDAAMTTTITAIVPGEGREIFARVGYRY